MTVEELKYWLKDKCETDTVMFELFNVLYTLTPDKIHALTYDPQPGEKLYRKPQTN